MAACALLLALPAVAVAAEVTTAPLTARGTATPGTTAQPVTTPALSARGLPATTAPPADDPEAPPARTPADITFTPVGERDRPASESPALAASDPVVTPALSARGLTGNGTAAPITTGTLSARGLAGTAPEAAPPAVDEAEKPAEPTSPFDPDGPAVIGKVLDARSGQPLAHVLVTDAGGALRACSDANGTYRLSVSPDRSYTLRLVRRGYEPLQINVYSGPKETAGDALLLPAPDLLLADCQGTPANADALPWAGKPVTVAADANSSIVGQVLDATTGRPLAWAIIRIEPGATTVTTNERGEYVAPVRVTEVAAEFKVSVEAEGYELPGGPIAVTVGRDRAQFGDVLMLPVTPPPTPLELTERTKLQELQGLLTDRGFSLGTVDGIIGTRTRQAIRDFQTSQGLPPDGTATEALLEILRATTPATEADTASDAPLDVRTGALVLVGHDTPLEVRTGPITLTGYDTPLEVRTGPITLTGYDAPLEIRTGPITLTGYDAPLEVRTGPITLTGYDAPLEIRTGPITLTGYEGEAAVPVTPPSIGARPVTPPPAGPDTVAELKLKSVRLMRVVPLAGGGDVNPFSVRDVETLISPRPLVLADGGGSGPIDPGTDPGTDPGNGSGTGSGGTVCLTPITRVIPANEAFSLVVDPATGSCGFTQFPTFAVAQFADCYGGLCVDGFAPWTIAPSGLLIAFNRVTFTIANGADRFTFTASVWGTDPMPDGSVIGSRTSGGQRADGEFVDKALVIESFTRTGAQGAINTSTEGTINDTPITPLFGTGSR